ncbi:potassium-transporting ATPase subunit F [Streptomyces clavuligerus]|nr:potassium-transporting ATPase subunit F [Streptomyces clavuligerus]ANW16894.1 K+-transporting ATPase subunit F [Streptomyces clavuligerus]AXU11423.1 potassium-transporting ATPase subunit F [Streptomyces clavuligerus]MBY6301241.1 potassium-transporting ATPase subunit F [Streptomyces clavuligerus]QCS04294.1 potassium-transporting ATPase subunit F [Streptomyces clavuligerus]QPJ96316.1 potassium-transporting ATPase subunit F [Streptomyces clavuligerus]
MSAENAIGLAVAVCLVLYLLLCLLFPERL